MTNRYIKVIGILSLATSLFSSEAIQIEVFAPARTKQQIDDTTSNIEVITSKQIEQRGYTTLVEALNSLSSISFTQDGGLGQTAAIRIRGMHQTNVLVLIDGIRYNDITSPNGAAFEHLMVSNIEKIEVIKGATSGIWGADASAGVINIVTKNAKDGLSAKVNREIGSLNRRKIGVSLSYKQDRYYIQLSGKQLTGDSVSAQAPRGEDINQYENDKYKNKTGTIKAGFSINDTNKIDISHTIIDSEVDYDAFASPDDTTSSGKSKSNFSKLSFSHIDSFNEFNIYAKKSIFARETGAINSKTKFDGIIKEYGTTSKIPYRGSDFVLIGTDYKKFSQDNLVNSATTTIAKDYTNRAFFATNSNKLGGLIFTQSIRSDRYTNFDDKTTGKLGIKYNFDKNIYISSNYGTAYKVPTLSQLYGQYGSNANLKPESTKSFDVTANYKAIKITYFRADVEDLHGFDAVTFQNINIDGTSTVKGYELSYRQNITDNLTANSSYTYTDAKDRDGHILGRVPKETMKFAIEYFGIKNTYLGANGEYIGQRWDRNYSSFNTPTPNGAQTGRYTLFGLTTRYSVNKHLDIYAKSNNIFDKYYQTVDGYATAGRTIYAGLNAKF
jgi:vitamin B12 transporter